jgi:hypothetical protein
MVSNSRTAGLIGVVVRRLRKDFQDDFYKRCFYAAFVMRALLVEAGVETEIVGGDFVAFTVSRYGARVGMQRFGFGEEQCSHFRVVAGGRLLDVRPDVLPNDSRYPVTAMPFVPWETKVPFPACLRYRPLQRFPAEAVMSSVHEHNARYDRFIADYRIRLSSQIAVSKPLTTLLTGHGATEEATRGRDPWALGALRPAGITRLAELQF